MFLKWLGVLLGLQLALKEFAAQEDDCAGFICGHLATCAKNTVGIDVGCNCNFSSREVPWEISQLGNMTYCRKVCNNSESDNCPENTTCSQTGLTEYCICMEGFNLSSTGQCLGETVTRRETSASKKATMIKDDKSTSLSNTAGKTTSETSASNTASIATIEMSTSNNLDTVETNTSNTGSNETTESSTSNTAKMTKTKMVPTGNAMNASTSGVDKSSTTDEDTQNTTLGTFNTTKTSTKVSTSTATTTTPGPTNDTTTSPTATQPQVTSTMATTPTSISSQVTTTASTTPTSKSSQVTISNESTTYTTDTTTTITTTSHHQTTTTSSLTTTSTKESSPTTSPTVTGRTTKATITQPSTVPNTTLSAEVTNDTAEASTTSATNNSTGQDTADPALIIGVATGSAAGLVVILIVIFFIIWFVTRRRRKRRKPGSQMNGRSHLANPNVASTPDRQPLSTTPKGYTKEQRITKEDGNSSNPAIRNSGRFHKTPAPTTPGGDDKGKGAKKRRNSDVSIGAFFFNGIISSEIKSDTDSAQKEDTLSVAHPNVAYIQDTGSRRKPTSDSKSVQDVEEMYSNRFIAENKRKTKDKLKTTGSEQPKSDPPASKSGVSNGQISDDLLALDDWFANTSIYGDYESQNKPQARVEPRLVPHRAYSRRNSHSADPYDSGNRAGKSQISGGRSSPDIGNQLLHYSQSRPGIVNNPDESYEMSRRGYQNRRPSMDSSKTPGSYFQVYQPGMGSHNDIPVRGNRPRQETHNSDTHHIRRSGLNPEIYNSRGDYRLSPQDARVHRHHYDGGRDFTSNEPRGTNYHGDFSRRVHPSESRHGRGRHDASAHAYPNGTSGVRNDNYHRPHQPKFSPRRGEGPFDNRFINPYNW